MNSRSNSLLTMFAFGLAAAAFAPRILRAIANGSRPVVSVPPSAPIPASVAPSVQPPVPPAAPPVALMTVEPAAPLAIEVPAPVAVEPPAPAPPEPPAPPPAPAETVSAWPAPPTYPWLQPAGQPAPSVEPGSRPHEAAPQVNQWAPAGAPPPPLPVPEPPRAFRLAPEAVPWNQGYQPLATGQYMPPRPGGDPAGLGWAPPGTYQPPVPIPFPTGGYRPPTAAAGYAAPAQAEPVVDRAPAAAAPSFVPPPFMAATAVLDTDGPLAEGDFGSDIFPRSSARHWLGTISSLIGILLLITVVATLVFVAVAPRALGWQFVVVSGGSMEPSIHLGSVAVMANVDTKTLKAGDVIMFTDPSQPGRAVTHRIVEVKDSGASFATRGDANKSADAGTVPASNVRGKFLFSIPAVGRFVRWMGTSQGYLVIILVPGIVIIFWELRSLSRSRSKPSGT